MKLFCENMKKNFFLLMNILIEYKNFNYTKLFFHFCKSSEKITSDEKIKIIL